MFFVYIIYSPSLDRFYIGHTNDLLGRIRRHNTNHKGFTGKANDWELKYCEKFNSQNEAHKRELEVKNRKSRRYLLKLINSVGSEHPVALRREGH